MTSLSSYEEQLAQAINRLISILENGFDVSDSEIPPSSEGVRHQQYIHSLKLRVDQAKVCRRQSR